MPEIKSKEITVTDFIGDKATFDKEGGYIWGVKVKEDGDYLQMIAEVRGWGVIQNLFKVGTEKFDLNDAEKFQDELGEWIADAINKKLQLPSQPGAAVFVPVDVTRRLPNDSEAHIVCITEGVYETYQIAWLNDDKKTWEFDGNEVENVTHWLEEQPAPTEIVLPGTKEILIDFAEALKNRVGYIIPDGFIENYLLSLNKKK